MKTVISLDFKDIQHIQKIIRKNAGKSDYDVTDIVIKSRKEFEYYNGNKRDTLRRNITSIRQGMGVDSHRIFLAKNGFHICDIRHELRQGNDMYYLKLQ